jgi:hypothetical protein
MLYAVLHGRAEQRLVGKAKLLLRCFVGDYERLVVCDLEKGQVPFVKVQQICRRMKEHLRKAVT